MSPAGFNRCSGSVCDYACLFSKTRFSVFPYSTSVCFALFQSKHDELEAKFIEERAVVEAKYQKLYETLYSKHYEIVIDMVEVDDITKSGDETDRTEIEGCSRFLA